MSSPAPKRATYAELLALPEGVRAELLSGSIVTEPAPLPEHAHVQQSIGIDIGTPYQRNHGRGGPGGWWILPEVDVEIEAGEVVRPDVSGWRRERLKHPGGVRPIRVVPDWVCEVTSPTSGGRDRVYKRALYARTGVQHYWLINPAERVLEALALRDGQWLEIGAYGDGDRARIAPFPDIELDVAQLFLPPPPTTEG